MEGVGQLAPYAKRPLGAGPHGEPALPPLRNGRPGLQRDVCDIGHGVRRIERAYGEAPALLDRSARVYRCGVRRWCCAAPQVLEEIPPRDPVRYAPLCPHER